jgi:hypothetical protein
VFRRLLLLRLHQAERLSESFLHNLLSWVHSGFSVFAGPPVEPMAFAFALARIAFFKKPGNRFKILFL